MTRTTQVTMTGYLSKQPYTPPPYAEMTDKLMRGTTQAMYETSVANFQALKRMEVSGIVYASDGLKVTGIEVVPGDLGPSETMPLMIYNRGGSGDYGVLSPGQVTVLMAPFVKRMRLGVLASNYRGNGGSEGHEEWGGADVNDVLNLVALGKAQPWWDGKNIFMLGWSRGGMMSYLALKAGLEVNAVAVGAGLADLYDNIERRRDIETMVVTRYANAADYALNRDAILRARSAVYWPEALNAPLLILHGDADETVHVAEARNLVAQLQALGKTVKYVEYAGGDHALKKFWKQWVDQVVSWFETYRK